MKRDGKDGRNGTDGMNAKGPKGTVGRSKPHSTSGSAATSGAEPSSEKPGAAKERDRRNQIGFRNRDRRIESDTPGVPSGGISMVILHKVRSEG